MKKTLIGMSLILSLSIFAKEGSIKGTYELVSSHYSAAEGSVAMKCPSVMTVKVSSPHLLLSDPAQEVIITDAENGRIIKRIDPSVNKKRDRITDAFARTKQPMLDFVIGYRNFSIELKDKDKNTLDLHTREFGLNESACEYKRK